MPETSLVVQKYGGTSLADAAAFKSIARRVVARRREGCSVVVVVSAMGDATDQLLALVGSLTADPDPRELDLLMATGELASAALMALAIRAAGAPAVALSGAQCGIITNSVHTNARIIEVRPARLRAELRAGSVVVAAGFQGVSLAGELTTLGRGGSDTSAVALAAALEADVCEIFTDVSGVFSADPRRVPGARPLSHLDHQEMKELAWQGARVLKAEAVEFARDNGIEIGVGSSGNGTVGTWVGSKNEPSTAWIPHRGAVSGVAGRSDLVCLQATDGLARSQIDALLAMIGRYDLVFGTMPSPGAPWTLYLSREEVPDLGAFGTEVRVLSGDRVSVRGPLGGVSLVGFGLGSRPRALLDASAILQGCGVEALDGWTNRESLSFVVPLESVDRAVLALHRTFVEQSSSEALGAWSA